LTETDRLNQLDDIPLVSNPIDPPSVIEAIIENKVVIDETIFSINPTHAVITMS